MPWRIHHSHIDLPCIAERGFAAAFARPQCDSSDAGGTTDRIRDAVTALLAGHGIEYEPVGDGEWLWCLGGPELVRTGAYDEYAAQNLCVDLNVWACPHHRVITARIWPHDLVPEWCDLDPPHIRRSQPTDLDGDDPAHALLAPLETWLDSILLLPR